jgi:hypothetical protein
LIISGAGNLCLPALVDILFIGFIPKDFFHVTIVYLVMDIQHLDHLADRGHPKKWVTPPDIEIRFG